MSNETAKVAEAWQAIYEKLRTGFEAAGIHYAQCLHCRKFASNFHHIFHEDDCPVGIISQALAAAPQGQWSEANQAGLNSAIRWLREQGNPELTAFNAADYLEGSARPRLQVNPYTQSKPTINKAYYWYSIDPETIEPIVIRLIDGRCRATDGISYTTEELGGWFCGPIAPPPSRSGSEDEK